MNNEESMKRRSQAAVMTRDQEARRRVQVPPGVDGTVVQIRSLRKGDTIHLSGNYPIARIVGHSKRGFPMYQTADGNTYSLSYPEGYIVKIKPTKTKKLVGLTNEDMGCNSIIGAELP